MIPNSFRGAESVISILVPWIFWSCAIGCIGMGACHREVLTLENVFSQNLEKEKQEEVETCRRVKDVDGRLFLLDAKFCEDN